MRAVNDIHSKLSTAQYNIFRHISRTVIWVGGIWWRRKTLGASMGRYSRFNRQLNSIILFQRDTRVHRRNEKRHLLKWFNNNKWQLLRTKIRDKNKPIHSDVLERYLGQFVFGIICHVSTLLYGEWHLQNRRDFQWLLHLLLECGLQARRHDWKHREELPLYV